jgi:hypothetical protein
LFANNFALGEKGDGDDGILLRWAQENEW